MPGEDPLYETVKKLAASVEELHDIVRKEEVTNQAFRENVSSAFPDKDFREHHVFHLERRHAQKQTEEIVLEGKKKIIGGVIWGLSFFLGYGIIEWLKSKMM